MKQIKIKYLADIEPIQKIEQGDWLDLRTSKDVWISPGEFILIPLGIAIELPKGYEAHIVPRSSTFKKWGVIQANHMGVIDESYCGDEDQLFFPAIGFWEMKIPKNTRICQMRLMKKMPEIELITVETLGNKNRGGVGSTGDK